MKRPKMDNTAARSPLDRDIAEFLADRSARGLAAGTLIWYRNNLPLFQEYSHASKIEQVSDITAGHLRRFLAWLEERGHNGGGRANIYGCVRAFLHWYADEYAPIGWQNPAAKVKGPKRLEEPLDPLPLDHIAAILATCERKTFMGERDRALILFLLDTGVRWQELTGLRIEHVDLDDGAALVLGKWRKWRTVYMGAALRRSLYAYLRLRPDIPLLPTAPLWLSRDGDQLSRAGIFEVVRRRAVKAGVPVPGMHAFRRAFAIAYLRNGGDVATLQRLMGHSDLRVINRYLKLLDEDLRRAHEQFSPADNMSRSRGGQAKRRSGS